MALQRQDHINYVATVPSYLTTCVRPFKDDKPSHYSLLKVINLIVIPQRWESRRWVLIIGFVWPCSSFKIGDGIRPQAMHFRLSSNYRYPWPFPLHRRTPGVCATPKFTGILMNFKRLYNNHHASEKYESDAKVIAIFYSLIDTIMNKLKQFLRVSVPRTNKLGGWFPLNRV